MTPNKTFEEVQKDFAKALTASTRASLKLNDARKLRDEMCPHTNTIEESYYNGGGYDYISYSEHWIKCCCCGAKSEVVRDSRGGSYS
jgi:hypothetical protein